MKQLILLFAALATIAACTPDGGGMKGSRDLNTSIDSMSYALGSMFSAQFEPQGIPVNAQQLGEGYAQSEAGTSFLDKEGSAAVMQVFQTAMMTRQGAPFTEGEALPFNIDTFSYALGYDLQEQMKGFDVSLNSATFLQGALDNGTEDAVFDKANIDAQVQALSAIIQEKQLAEAAAAAGPNIETGAAFIAEKAAEEGVQSTASGLHYKVIQKGSGASPAATDKVTVHYTGTLIDGTVFDSSVERGQPATFGLNQVIAGWTEGVQLMQPGAKYQFYIPYQLAYGERGSPPNIGPGETLIFDIELISIGE